MRFHWGCEVWLPGLRAPTVVLPHSCCWLLQVLVRWALDRGCSVLPKSTNAERIAANLAVLDWQLAPEDSQLLSNLPYRVRQSSCPSSN